MTACRVVDRHHCDAAAIVGIGVDEQITIGIVKRGNEQLERFQKANKG